MAPARMLAGPAQSMWDGVRLLHAVVEPVLAALVFAELPIAKMGTAGQWSAQGPRRPGPSGMISAQHMQDSARPVLRVHCPDLLGYFSTVL
jgi:hypothetical protein